MNLAQGIAQILLDQNIRVDGQDQDGALCILLIMLPDGTSCSWLELSVVEALVWAFVFRDGQRTDTQRFDLGVPTELDRLLAYVHEVYDARV